MKIVLLSGGSGKRLWPLSNQYRPKQFLQVLPRGDSENESMVQRVYRQIRAVAPDAEVLVTASADQCGLLMGQLGSGVMLLSEPEKRDTYPAVMLAASYLYSALDTDPEEPIVILPVDTYATGEYYEIALGLADVAASGSCNLALLGVRPTYATQKYGYIRVEGSRVTGFTEKPPVSEAERLVAEGAYWNAGVFAGKLSYLLDILSERLGTSRFVDVLHRYTELERTSFDRAVVEREPNILMRSYDGEWKDLGTWNTLTEEMAEAVVGNTLIGEGATHTYVVNELPVPVVALGTSDMIIAATSQGILVSDLGQSSFLKPYVERIEAGGVP